MHSLDPHHLGHVVLYCPTSDTALEEDGRKKSKPHLEWGVHSLGHPHLGSLPLTPGAPPEAVCTASRLYTTPLGLGSCLGAT